MKQSRYKKMLGLAIADRSLLVAEIAAGDRPQVTRAAELIYPEGLSAAHPAELGKALAHFLKENHFSARAAVIGIPLKWIVVKHKEVPPADDATLAQLLRLEAEAEFSSELKDLVYDFASESGAAKVGRPVLLAATPRKYIESVELLCEGARLQPVAIAPSAMVLGSATGVALGRNVLVLSVTESGSELSAQRGGTSTAIRHLRSPMPRPPFVNELRRAVSTLGSAPGEREMVLWDAAGMDAAALGEDLGIAVHGGELPSLGADASPAGMNGDGSKYAAAVSLAMAGLGTEELTVDFLHSRLAPPRQRRIPRWAYLAALAGAVLLAGIVYAYIDLGRREAEIDNIKRLSPKQADVDAAQRFVSKVSVAQYWHGGDPRYLACLRDLDGVIPRDQQTYATSLDINAQTPPIMVQGNAAGGGKSAKSDETRTLSITLQGKTSNVESVTALQDRMRDEPSVFQDPNIVQDVRVPRSDDWMFSITFTYVPPPIPAVGDRQAPAKSK